MAAAICMKTRHRCSYVDVSVMHSYVIDGLHIAAIGLSRTELVPQ